MKDFSESLHLAVKVGRGGGGGEFLEKRISQAQHLALI